MPHLALPDEKFAQEHRLVLSGVHIVSANQIGMVAGASRNGEKLLSEGVHVHLCVISHGQTASSANSDGQSVFSFDSFGSIDSLTYRDEFPHVRITSWPL